MELSILQQKILNCEDKKIVVNAAAASGKTRLLTEKLRQILNTGVEPTKVVAITFTNLAAEEMRQRLGDDYRDGLFIGTIHSLANYILRSNCIDTSEILDNEQFDELFPMIQKNPTCVPEVKYLLLDEAQDTTEMQYEFIFSMINPEYFFVCGDVRQSIYQWNDARPDLFADLSRRADVTVFDMNENYRNDKRILDFAKKIILKTGINDTSRAMSYYAGYTEFNVEDPFLVMELIDGADNYKEWAILTRTNDQLAYYKDLLEKKGIPCSTFKRADMTMATLKEELDKDTIKILTIHCAKGLEWDNVIVVGTQSYNQEELNISYVAATRARHNLFWFNKPRYKKKTRYTDW